VDYSERAQQSLSQWRKTLTDSKPK
jgi:hypothetical protein